ncbi:hypothetical protein BKA70DRAFT_1225187 [Coprinopsis sp. MPI-PUGE-AT-0042]|nr:hypothetical protein BKA70DRAFT_1225187 [Coprinopsis sp. MPI-PUGE-AT-0042]
MRNARYLKGGMGGDVENEEFHDTSQGDRDEEEDSTSDSPSSHKEKVAGGEVTVLPPKTNHQPICVDCDGRNTLTPTRLAFSDIHHLLKFSSIVTPLCLSITFGNLQLPHRATHSHRSTIRPCTSHHQFHLWFINTYEIHPQKHLSRRLSSESSDEDSRPISHSSSRPSRSSRSSNIEVLRRNGICPLTMGKHSTAGRLDEEGKKMTQFPTQPPVYYFVKANGSTSSLNHLPYSGKKYDLSGHVKQPLYCPSRNRRAARDGDTNLREGEEGVGGVLGCGSSAGSLQTAKERREEKLGARRRWRRRRRRWRRRRRGSRPMPTSSCSPSSMAASTAPSSFTPPYIHPSPSDPTPRPLSPCASPSPSAPPTHKPRYLAFIPRRGPTSILPPIHGLRPTSSHSQSFSDSQLPTLSTWGGAGYTRCGEYREGTGKSESQGEATRVFGDATNTNSSSRMSSGNGKLKSTTAAPTNFNPSMPGTPSKRIQSVSASESVGHSPNAVDHPASVSVPSPPTFLSSSPSQFVNGNAAKEQGTEGDRSRNKPIIWLENEAFEGGGSGCVEGCGEY